MNACRSCGSGLTSVLVCEACGDLQPTPSVVDPHAALGLEVGQAVDPEALRKLLLRLQRRMHPDFFGDAPEEVRALAERNTAELNAAHSVLADDFRRADLLVARLGGPDEASERQMPAEFLMEVLEWNETLEAARETGSDEKVDALESELRDRRGATMGQIEGALTPLPEPGSSGLTDIRRLLNAVRYLDRTLDTLGELRLEQQRSDS